jgi:hypothetical protein
MAPRPRLAVSLALILVALGPIAPACANFGVPSECVDFCDVRDAAPCQKCIAEEDQKRAEAGKRRAEERRQSQPSPSYPSGGSGY